MMPWQIKNR